jgi:hypothetical protein
MDRVRFRKPQMGRQAQPRPGRGLYRCSDEAARDGHHGGPADLPLTMASLSAY